MKTNLVRSTIWLYFAVGIYIIIVILFPGKFIDVTPIPAKIEPNKGISTVLFVAKARNLQGVIVRVESSEQLVYHGHFSLTDLQNNNIILQKDLEASCNEQYKLTFPKVSGSLNKRYLVIAEFTKPILGTLKVFPLYRMNVAEAFPLLLNNHIFNRPFPFNMKGTHLILAGSYIFCTFLILRIILFLRD